MLTPNALRHIYHSLIYPNLTYCHVVWGAAGSTKTKQVATAQKRAIRTIACLKSRQHSNDSFAEFRILKYDEVNSYCCA